MDMEDSGHVVIWINLPVFSWLDWRKLRKSYARIAGLRSRFESTYKSDLLQTSLRNSLK